MRVLRLEIRCSFVCPWHRPCGVIKSRCHLSFMFQINYISSDKNTNFFSIIQCLLLQEYSKSYALKWSFCHENCYVIWKLMFVRGEHFNVCTWFAWKLKDFLHKKKESHTTQMCDLMNDLSTFLQGQTLETCVLQNYMFSTNPKCKYVNFSTTKTYA